MKKFSLESLVAGFIIGTMSVTTVFAATGIKSAIVSNAQVTLNGAFAPLDKPLVAVTMDDETNASLYMPIRELLEYLGYTVEWDGVQNTVNLFTSEQSHINSRLDNEQDIIGNVSGNTILNISNKNGFNIAESGSFQAESNQTLVLEITSTIKGGSVDLFLFDPSGREQRITISETTTTREIALSSGRWQWNCTGMFRDGGNISIIGVIR